MKVYFIAGLGANSRSFKFLDLSWCQPVFIDWIKPEPRETLPHYALRLRQLITEPNPIVVGVSFGGMLVTEMAKSDPSMKAIIISSNKTAAEFPAYWRWWKNFPVYRWVSPQVISLAAHATKGLIGPKGKLQKQNFATILKETDHSFTAWAVDAILHWNNKEVPSNVVHIHGSGDRLLPIRLVTPHHVIAGGKHIMIMDRAEELSALLKKLIKD